MNKMFTATAVLQLAQSGKLKLADPLGKYITDYPNKEVAKVTIHQLLTHTGGTGDIFGPEYQQRRLQLRTLNDYVKLYGDRPLRFEPGSKWEYSNYGFILLGMIIERVAGQSYYDYVHDHIFRPTGMTSTASEPEEVQVPNRSKGYMRNASGWQLNTDTLPYRGTSAGGGYSTVEDLLRFANAIQGRKLLNDEYTKLLTTGKVEVSEGSKYAYGFQETTDSGLRYLGHSGGAPGMNGELRIYPDTGYVVVALGNTDGATQRAMGWIEGRLPSK
jgi:CubicO group peptidase (beta-lactamase class C family)